MFPPWPVCIKPGHPYSLPIGKRTASTNVVAHILQTSWLNTSIIQIPKTLNHHSPCVKLIPTWIFWWVNFQVSIQVLWTPPTWICRIWWDFPRTTISLSCSKISSLEIWRKVSLLFSLVNSRISCQLPTPTAPRQVMIIVRTRRGN